MTGDQAMTPTEAADFLRSYNKWRSLCGLKMPSPREIGKLIDAVLDMIDRLEAAEKERDDAKAAAENIALKLDYLRSKLETAENAQNDWLRANAPGGWIDNLRIENEALRAEIIHIKEVEFPRKAQAVADGWRGKCERLEAKIEQMERQEPVMWVNSSNIDSSRINRERGGCGDQHTCSEKQTTYHNTPLYALPGAQGEMKLSEKIQEALREELEIIFSDPAVQKRLAAHWGYVPAEAQPAPSVSDATWLPVPDKHPTFAHVDLLLADGSVLCDCLPQSDGDYWWEGPSGEVFIDPRYAPVTHWRLSSPETKL